LFYLTNKNVFGVFKALLKISGGDNCPVPAPGCGPEQLRVFHSEPKHTSAYLRRDETVQCAPFGRFAPHILQAIFNCPNKRRLHWT